MRHLKPHPILESNSFGGDIEILNEISDIFNFLEDEWGFSLEYALITYEEKRYGSKKYTSTIYDLSGEEVYKYPSADMSNKKLWNISGNSQNLLSSSIREIYNRSISSVNMVESMLGLEKFEFKFETQKRKGDIFYEISSENSDILYDVDTVNKLDITIQFKESDINLQFRK